MYISSESSVRHQHSIASIKSLFPLHSLAKQLTISHIFLAAIQHSQGRNLSERDGKTAQSLLLLYVLNFHPLSQLLNEVSFLRNGPPSNRFLLSNVTDSALSLSEPPLIHDVSSTSLMFGP